MNHNAQGPLAVLFDWGGVLSNAGRAGQVGERLAKALDLPAAEAFTSWGRPTRG